MTCERKIIPQGLSSPSGVEARPCGGELEEKATLSVIIDRDFDGSDIVKKSKLYQCASCKDIIVKQE